jgi:hypothetical protein
VGRHYVFYLTGVVLVDRMLPSTFAAKVPDDEYFSEQPMRMKHKRLLAHFFVEVRAPFPLPPQVVYRCGPIIFAVGDGSPLLLVVVPAVVMSSPESFWHGQ